MRAPKAIRAPRRRPLAAALLKSFEQINEKPADELTLAASEIKKVLAEDSAKAEQVIAQLMRTAGQFTGKRPLVRRDDGSSLPKIRYANARLDDHFFRGRCSRVASGREKLLVRLSTDAEMRSRLIASADALSNRAGEILVPSADGASTAYVQAMKRLIDTNKTSYPHLVSRRDSQT